MIPIHRVTTIAMKTRVKQSRFIIPTPFSNFLAELHLTTNILPTGLELNLRVNKKLLNLLRLHFRTKVTRISLVLLQDTENACVYARSEAEFQNTVVSLMKQMRGWVLHTQLLHQGQFSLV